MAEPYSDEQLASRDERWWGPGFLSDARWRATCERLMRERDVLAEFAKGWPDAVEENDRLRAERDEARRVAKVLAQRTTASQHDWAEVMTALDYPEVKP
jgi:hypothetical protein